MKLNAFSKYAWGMVLVNVAVILWGGVVSGTGSGAGCGAHWPLCDGEVIPRAPGTAQLIEFSHRVTSGLALLAVLGLAVWAFRAYPKGHRVRLGAALSVVFIIIEALIGAALVLFGWVAFDTSPMRAFMQPVHLLNAMLLLAWLTLTAWWASGGAAPEWRGRRRLAAAFAAGLLGVILVGATGALISMGDLIFPAESLAAGLAAELDPASSFLVRLRLWHPAIAIGVGLYLIGLANFVEQAVPTMASRRLARLTVGLVLAQWVAGFVNVLLLVPLTTQLVHLFLADALWISLVLWLAAALAPKAAAAPVDAKRPALGEANPAGG